MRNPKSVLLSGCALGAVLLASAQPARGQAFDGTPATQGGSVTYNRGNPLGPGTETITINSPQAVIVWDTPSSPPGPDIFLPAGNTARFQGAVGNPDFAVLNRVNPTGPAVAIEFDGTVQSIVSAAAASPTTGGTVWFYNPNGIIVGQTAVFNVGSLALTTNDVPFTAAGTFIGAGGLAQFVGPANSTSAVVIQPGAQITAAAANGAYVALVAPRVVQGGTVSADGDIAYIAAEQVDMTINGGLFDFVITAGTTDPEGVVHTGNTTGPASTSAADLQRISIVALPKNAALTMMLSGSIGYTPAASAANEGSSVVLAAGFNDDSPTALPGNALGNIAIGNSLFRNQLTAYASSTIAIDPAAGTAAFLADAQLYGLDLAGIDVGPSESVVSTGNLSLYAGRPGQGGAIGISAQGKGAINIAGTLLADASSSAAQFVAAPVFLSAVGGLVSILADGGTIDAAGLTARAGAVGGFDAASGGDALGGTIAAAVNNGGAITSSAVNFDANATGGDSDTLGGAGTGGDLSLIGTSGTLNFGSVTLAANGMGGASAGDAGNGIGGTVAIGIASDTLTWSSLVARADATGGVQLVPGTGNAGSATGADVPVSLDISGNGTSLTILNDATLSADTFIGIDGQPGFTGHAGNVVINVGQTATLDVRGTLLASADARIDGSVTNFSPDRSATQIGGTVTATVDGGTLIAFDLSLGANAVGLSGTTAAGTATGGTVALTAQNGGSVSIANGLDIALISLNADASGSPGPLPADAQGGTVKLVANDGSIFTTGNVLLSANAAMGPFTTLPANGAGFNATGGTVTIDLPLGALGTASIDTAITIEADAIGDARVILAGGTSPPGGETLFGNGGTGAGGNVTLTENAGLLSGTALRLNTAGYGGASAAIDAAAPFQSGAGIGGIATMVQSGGSAELTTVELLSDGQGGGGGPAASGLELAALAGDGTGGSALLSLLGGSLNVTDTALSASGTGAGGMDHGGDGDASGGGIGTGGTINLQVPAGWTGEFNSNSTLYLTADGTGGVGGLAAGAGLDPPTASNGDGGDGIGGTIIVGLADGQFNFGTMRIEAVGIGGYSGDASSGIPDGVGGEGLGGTASFDLTDSAAGPVGARTIGGLFLNTDGLGGFGSVFVAESTEGTLTFNLAVFDATTPLGLTGNLELLNRAVGVPGPAGITATIAGAPLTVGGSTLMSTTRDLVVTAVEPLHGLGDVTLAGATVTTTGLVQADGSLYVTGANSIAADLLVAGGITDLYSFNGPIMVNDLESVGPVQADGASVDISSPGALAFDHIVAFAGPIVVHTVGNLDLVTANATGSLTLTSATGAVTGTGPITSGAATIDAPSGVTLASLDADGATQLTSTGTVDVDALASTGPVDVTANAVDIDGVGALTFVTAQSATTMRIVATGDLAFAAVDAGADLTLESTLGSLSAAGDVSGGPIALGAGTDIDLVGTLTAAGPLTVDALGSFTVGGNTVADSADVDADGGIALPSLASGGTTALRAINGPVTIASLSSAGNVTALGSTVDLTAPGALAVASAQATAGNLRIVAAGNLASASSQASGDVDLRSTGGAIAATGPVVAGGTLALAGNSGITAGTVTSGGTTALQSANGGVTVTALGSAGAVTAQGRFIDIDAPGALAFADARATAGPVQIDTQGDLTLAQGGASGGLFLTSANGAVTGTGPLTAGNDASVVAPLGVSLASLDVGGTTLLRATGGPVAVTSLTSAGNVTAFGGSVDIASPGALTFTDLDATAGPLSVVTAGDLTLATVDATGATTLRSTGGALAATGPVVAGGALALTGNTGITAGTVTSGGTTALQSANGGVTVTALGSAGAVTAQGRFIDIDAPGALAFADARATAGPVQIDTQGDLTLAQGGASGGLFLTSANGAVTGTGPLTAGNDASVVAPLGVSLASLDVGGTTLLRATGGPVAVTSLTSAGNVTAFGGSVDIASPGALTFTDLDATAGPLSVVTAGDLTLATVDATGATTLRSTGGALAATGPVVVGGTLALAGNSGITAGTVTSGGTTALQSANGGVTVTALGSAGAVTAQGRFIDIDAPGALAFADARATAGPVQIDTQGDLTLAQGGASGGLFLTSANGAVTGIGPLTAGNNASVVAPLGVSLASLDVGGTTLLRATGGPVAVTSLTSAGNVTAFGGSVDIASPGALTFTDLDATAGPLSVVTAGDLTLATVDATGATTLRSTGGALAATGPVVAGGTLALAGNSGITAGTVTSGGTTALQSANGGVTVTALGSAGAVTAQGRFIDIDAPGALAFADARATAGPVQIDTQGDLTLAQGGASGGLFLTSANGAVTGIGPLTAGNNASVVAPLGVSLASLDVGGTTLLRATGGPVAVTSLTSAGNVTAFGGSVDIASPGALTFTDLDATAGPLSVVTAGDLTLATVDATGATTLRSTGGALAATGPVVAGGTLALAGNSGITAGTVTSGGTTALQSANGGVTVTALGSAGAVTAQGRFIDIGAPGALAFADARATAGPVQIDTQGDLTLAQGGASGGLFLTSANGAVTGIGPLTAGNNASVVAPLGVSLASLDVGGTTLLRATGGPVAVTSLTSAGNVTAFGGSVDIASPGALTFTDLDATAGPLSVVTAGDLTLATVDATGATTLRSTGGALAATGPVVAGGTLALAGNSGITAGTATSGGATALQSANGGVTVTALGSAGAVTAQGRFIDIDAPGALTFAAVDATAGDLLVQTGGNLATPDATATGSLTLQTTAGNIATGDLTAGTWLYVDAAGSAALGNLTAALDAAATTRVGDLALGDVTAGDEIWLSVFGADPTTVLTAGNLVTTGFGDDGAAGPPVLFGAFPGGAGPTGNVTRVRSAGSVAIADITTPGRAIIVADRGTTSAGAVSADEALIVLGRGDIDFVSATTGGALYVADSAMFALLPDAYDPASLAGVDPVRTTGGLSTVGAIDAGSVSIAVGGDATLPEVDSGGTTLLSAGGTIDVASLSSTEAVAATAGDSLLIEGTGPLTFTAARALNEVSVVTPGDLAFVAVSAGLYLTLESTDGSLTASGDVAGAFAHLTAGGDIALAGSLHSAGTLAVSAGGSFSVTGEATADDARITADSGITMSSLQAGEITRFDAVDGAIRVGDLHTGAVYASGRDVDISSSGSLRFIIASATDGDVRIRTSDNLDIAQADASDAIDLDVGATFSLFDHAIGTTIGVTSADIEIDSEANLGSQGMTHDITLANRDSESRTYVGGEAHGSDYSLDHGEIGRLFSDVAINILSDSNIVIDDFALGFGQGANIGSGGTLHISSPNIVSVIGDVALTTASADDTFEIDPGLLTLDTSTGSIALLGGGGAPLGRLTMVGDTIAVATTSTLGQIVETPDFAAINALLDQPGGTPQPLRAGTLTFDVVDALYIQNTGETAIVRDRAGFTAGGVAISTESGSTRIAINGQVLTAGGPLTGLDTQQGVTINGAAAAAGGQFDPGSTINGCVIGANCAPPPGAGAPSDSDLKQPLPPDTSPPSLFVAPIIQLAGSDPLVEPPLVDEPITGIGNDDLWEPHCAPDKETCSEASERP